MRACEHLTLPKMCEGCVYKQQEDCPLLKIPHLKCRIEELESQKNQFKETSEIKSEFLANVSHEIRTPMNAILGLSYLLAKTNINPEQKNYLEKINSASKTLLGIMNDILDFSKLEANKMEIHWEQVDIILLLEEVISIVRWGLEEKRLRFFCLIGANVPRFIKSDSIRLKQILLNILNNAVKFTDKGEIILELSWVNRALQFTIKDSGIGISSENQLRLFQPFTQFISQKHNKSAGTGLGLAITNNLVQLMGGLINVESQTSKGSTFTISIPQDSSQNMPLFIESPFNKFDKNRFYLIEENHLVKETLEKWARTESCNFNVFSDLASLIKFINEQKINKLNCFVFISRSYLQSATDVNQLKQLKNMETQNNTKICLFTHYGENYLLQEDWIPHIDFHFTQPLQSWTYAKLFEDLSMGSTHGFLGSVAERVKDSEQSLLNIKILLAEDNVVNQMVAHGILTKLGANVVIAENGEETLKQLGSNPKGFDLILLDIQMPIMDGFEACEKIKEHPQLNSIPIIALTAHLTDTEKAKFEASGMNDFIFKPFDPEILVKKILKFCRPILPQSISSDAVKQELKYQKQELLKQTNLDWGLIEKRTGNNDSLMREILSRFIYDFMGVDEQLKNFYLKGQNLQFERQIYALRAISNFIGAKGLIKYLEILEQSGKEKIQNKVFETLVEFSKELNQIILEIQIYLKRSSRAVDCELNI